ncbi:MAG: hypothetical protein ABI321_19965 [Polyangia bacterium]
MERSVIVQTHVQFVEHVDRVRTGTRLATVSRLGIDIQNAEAS